MTAEREPVFDVLASYTPGPTPHEASAIIRQRAQALYDKAQHIQDAPAREAAVAEARALLARADRPGRWSTAARSESLRAQRMHDA